MSAIVQLFRRKSREKDEFKSLLRPYIELLYAMAYRWTQSQADAEDLVQSILITLAPRVDEMRQIDDLKPWLMRILYRRYVDLYRKQKRTPEESENQWQADDGVYESRINQVADDDDQIQRLQMQRALAKGLAELEPEQRDCILLHDVEGYTAQETAEILGIQPGTVKSRLHRSRNKLKEILQTGTF